MSRSPEAEGVDFVPKAQLEPCMQANKAHPYYRYGYSLALGVGLAAAAYAWLKDPAKPQTTKDHK